MFRGWYIQFSLNHFWKSLTAGSPCVGSRKFPSEWLGHSSVPVWAEAAPARGREGGREGGRDGRAVGRRVGSRCSLTPDIVLDEAHFPAVSQRAHSLEVQALRSSACAQQPARPAAAAGTRQPRSAAAGVVRQLAPAVSSGLRQQQRRRTSSSFCWSIACISSVSWCVPGGFCASTAASRAAASAGMSIEFRRRNVSVLIGAPHGSAPGRSPAFCRARAAAGSEVCGMSQSAALAGHRFDILSASGSSAGRCSGTHRADPVHCRATACGGGGYWCCNTPDQAASPWRPAIIPAAVQQRRRSGCPASQCRGTVRCGRAQVAQHRKSSS
jgi:hypothetical protein